MAPRGKRNTKRPNRRNFKRGNKRTRAYKPRAKKRFIRSSNPIAENKQIEAADISEQVGLDTSNNPILYDISKPPVYLNTQLPIDGSFTVANLPTGGHGYPLTDSVYNFNPDSNLYQTHGLNNSSMIGSSVYQRLTAAKILIKWPQTSMNTGQWNGNTDDLPADADPLEDRLKWLAAPENNVMGLIPETPTTYHMYWGFVNVKMGLSNFTTPKADEVTAHEIEHHINQRVEDWFNQRQDRTQFIPRNTSNLHIIGKKRLSPPWDNRTGRMPVSYTAEAVADDFVNHDGSIPDTLVKITWPINRKVHFQKTLNLSGNGVTAGGEPVSGEVAYYKNHSFMPFMVIVNWNAERMPKNITQTPQQNADDGGEGKFERTRRVPHVIINDLTYYRDQ